MSTTESEEALTEEVLNTWSTPDSRRIQNFMAGVAFSRLDELDEVEL